MSGLGGKYYEYDSELLTLATEPGATMPIWYIRDQQNQNIKRVTKIIKKKAKFYVIKSNDIYHGLWSHVMESTSWHYYTKVEIIKLKNNELIDYDETNFVALWNQKIDLCDWQLRIHDVCTYIYIKYI